VPPEALEMPLPLDAAPAPLELGPFDEPEVPPPAPPSPQSLRSTEPATRSGSTRLPPGKDTLRAVPLPDAAMRTVARVSQASSGESALNIIAKSSTFAPQRKSAGSTSPGSTMSAAHVAAPPTTPRSERGHARPTRAL